MDITIIEAPRTTAFTTVARMREELGLTSNAQDSRLETLIEEVSADIVAYCHQPFIRQTVMERQVGYGRTVQTLSVTPVPHGGVSQVLFGGATISGYRVSNPDAGFLFRELRWPDTRQRNQWIESDPAIMPGNPDFEFYYSGGYVMPNDDVTLSGSGEVQVNSSDASFELLNNVTTFPIMVSGESLITAGFSNATNNGRWKILARTTSKLFVEGSLTDETPSGYLVSFSLRTLPRDLERLAVTEIKGRYLSQRRDPTIKSESLGDWSASYGSTAGEVESSAGLLPQVSRGLDKYVRLD